MRKICTALLSLVLLALAPMAQGQTPQDVLKQYVSDLQKNPGATVLREKIIRHVQTMKKAPAIPAEAERFEGRAEFAFKDAKNEADFLAAAKEYEKALLVAPWVPAYYFNQGVAFEKGDKLSEARQSFEFYLLAAHDAPDAREVRKRIAGLEYAMEKAAKESSPEAVALRKQMEYEQWLKKLDGARYTGQSSFMGTISENELVIRGSTLTWKQRTIYAAPDVILDVPLGQWYDMARYSEPMQIIGRQAERRLTGGAILADVLTISEDGNSITEVEQARGGSTFTFYRQ